jgi:hypothetical protein
MDTDIITATIPEFCRISGIGRSKTYELIATRELESILCSGRRLIVIDSWRRLIASAPRDRPAPGDADRTAGTNSTRAPPHPHLTERVRPRCAGGRDRGRVSGVLLATH